jgi:hypothetical protein
MEIIIDFNENRESNNISFKRIFITKYKKDISSPEAYQYTADSQSVDSWNTYLTSTKLSTQRVYTSSYCDYNFFGKLFVRDLATFYFVLCNKDWIDATTTIKLRHPDLGIIITKKWLAHSTQDEIITFVDNLLSILHNLHSLKTLPPSISINKGKFIAIKLWQDTTPTTSYIQIKHKNIFSKRLHFVYFSTNKFTFTTRESLIKYIWCTFKTILLYYNMITIEHLIDRNCISTSKVEGNCLPLELDNIIELLGDSIEIMQRLTKNT